MTHDTAASNVTTFPAHRVRSLDPQIANAAAGAIAHASTAWDGLLAARTQSLLAPLVLHRNVRDLCAVLREVTHALNVATQPITTEGNTHG